MFDNRSDYAQNKRDKDSIIYISVTGPVRLTRADFPSEAEFLKWKRWSDGDYHATEKAGRGERDNCLPLVVEFLDYIASDPSVEDKLFQRLAEAEAGAERARRCAELMAQIRGRLTEKQFRRVWLYYVEKLNEREIAALEQVGQQRISKSLIACKKILRKYFPSSLTGGKTALQAVNSEGHAFPLPSPNNKN